MKNIIFAAIISVLLLSMKWQATSSVKFDEYAFNFGKIKQGKPVKHTFRFKNVSKQPVIIKNITTSCGCTVPEYSKIPVLPEQFGNIMITYDAKEPLPFNKTAIVFLSSKEDPIFLNVKGEVTN